MSSVSRETKTIFVVEGKNDASVLKQHFPEISVMITNGSSVPASLLLELKQLSEENTIVLLLDPDGPGEKIRKKITSEVSNVQHIFVDRKLAISKNRKKVGIEHMTKEDLIEALNHVKWSKNSLNIQRNQLLDLNLLGKPDSKALREYVCLELKIGYANAKTFLSKINMFGVTIEELKKTVRDYYDR